MRASMGIAGAHARSLQSLVPVRAHQSGRPGSLTPQHLLIVQFVALSRGCAACMKLTESLSVQCKYPMRLCSLVHSLPALVGSSSTGAIRLLTSLNGNALEKIEEQLLGYLILMLTFAAFAEYPSAQTLVTQGNRRNGTIQTSSPARPAITSIHQSTWQSAAT